MFLGLRGRMVGFSAVSPRRMKPISPRWLVFPLVALGAGFAYGFLVGDGKVFPYALLRELVARVRQPQNGGDGGSSSEQPSGVEPGTEHGWFNPVRQSAPSEAEAMDGLEALGYAQSYQASDDLGRIGVVAHDPERAYAGANLVVSAHAPEVSLMDMAGETLHTWSFDYDDVPVVDDFEPAGTFGLRYFRRARLMPGGELLGIYDRAGLVRIDRDSKLIWGLRGMFHHDLDVTPDGTIWALFHEVHVVPRIHATREIFEDFVVRLAPDGTELGRFSLLEAFERSRYAALLEKARPVERPDIFHTNTLTVLDGSLAHLSPLFREGMLLISVFELDVVALVDPEAPDGPEVAWALAGLWHHQHEPVLVEDGNLLVFDNSGHRGQSKVVELDPFTQRIDWLYEGSPESPFYSVLCGSNQRLPNGNTLITESIPGRAFEVTRDKEIVWDFESPHRVFGGPTGDVLGVAVLMEVVRLGPETSLDWLADTPGGTE